MEVSLAQIGKRFQRQWLYRSLDASLRPHEPLAILGKNGSGKSTLLQIISGYLTPTEGKVTYTRDNQAIKREQVWQNVAIASPHLELHSAMTLAETVEFHHALRPIPRYTTSQAAAVKMGLEAHLSKPLKSFSSGMRQRVKLYLAIEGGAPLLLLDEPTANLDRQGVIWFRELLTPALASGRTIAVCSNAEGEETDFCTQRLQLEHFRG